MSYKSRVKRIQQSFGKRPDVEYYTGDMEHIRSYYETRVHSEPDRFYIDTITWNDLDMDAVFKRINTGLSTAGEQYLYYMLHRPMTQPEYEHQQALIQLVSDETETRCKLGLLTKAPFAAVIAFIPTKKRRRRASSNTLNHPFEVHGGSRKKAVVFRCRYSSSCETCKIVASLLDREGTLAPDLPQSQSLPVFRRASTLIFYFARFMEIAALNHSSLLMAAFADAPAL